MSKFNCKVKPIVFSVTLNPITSELCVHFKHKRFIHITQKHFDYYKENYDCLFQSSVLGKIWLLKSKKV